MNRVGALVLGLFLAGCGDDKCGGPLRQKVPDGVSWALCTEVAVQRGEAPELAECLCVVTPATSTVMAARRCERSYPCCIYVEGSVTRDGVVTKATACKCATVECGVCTDAISKGEGTLVESCNTEPTMSMMPPDAAPADAARRRPDAPWSPCVAACESDCPTEDCGPTCLGFPDPSMCINELQINSAMRACFRGCASVKSCLTAAPHCVPR